MVLSDADRKELERIAGYGASGKQSEKAEPKKTTAQGTRYRVATVQANPAQLDDDSQMTEEERRTHEAMKRFGVVLNHSPRLKNTFQSLGMLIYVLRNSNDPRNNVIGKIGFDRDNLLHLLVASFSQAKGEVVGLDNISDYLLFLEHEESYVMYYDLLDLTNDSTIEEIAQRCSIFAERFKRLNELIKYPYCKAIIDALKEIENNPNPQVAAKDIIEKHKLTGVGKLFDTNIAGIMVMEAKDGNVKPLSNLVSKDETESEDDTPLTPPIDLEGAPDYVVDFYTKYGAELFFTAYFHLWEALKSSDVAFQAQYQQDYFGGDDRATVIKKLNTASFGLGGAFFSAAEGSRKMADFLDKFATSFGISDADELEEKMHEFYYYLISPLYTGILSEGDPIRVAKELPEKHLGPEDDNKTNTFLWYLFQALKADETDYDQNYKAQIFKGMSLNELKKTIKDATRRPDQQAGEASVGEAILEAIGYADASNQDKYYPAQVVCDAVSEAYDINEPEELKIVVMDLGMTLRKLFPDVLQDQFGTTSKKEKAKEIASKVSEKATEGARLAVDHTRKALNGVLNYFGYKK